MVERLSRGMTQEKVFLRYGRSNTMSMSAKQAKELPTYLTLKELAELLKVKPRTVYAWVSDKRIPFARKGGLLRFRLDAVLAWNEPKSGRLGPSFAILGDASRRRL